MMALTDWPVALAATRFAGALAALGFALLIIDALVRRERPVAAAYLAALTGTLLWLVAEIGAGWSSPPALLAESARNLGWLWFMASIAGERGDRGRLSAVGWIYVCLSGLTMVSGVIGWWLPESPEAAQLLAPLRMLFAIGALVLLHNLYDAARPEERRQLSLPVAALTAMWAYDLNLYAIAYLSREPAGLMEMVRPAAALVLFALFGLAALRPAGQGVRLSRPVAFRSLALVGIAGWLLLLALVAALASATGSRFGFGAQVAVLLTGVLAGLAMLVSSRLRASLRVWISKHFFEHRYDYRSEWLRFTSTLNRPEARREPLDVRIVKAIADVVESGGGALVTEDDADVAFGALWPDGAMSLPDEARMSALFEWAEQSQRIIQFDELRAGRGLPGEAAVVPQWLLEDQRLWAAVPLIHHDRLVGIVLLLRPAVDRALDWEDFDLLKVCGQQAASYLAEARGSEALLESRRFEEFHRRFAFVMHDVKNLASQLGLLARNIERHGDNPAFREDMIATVRLSADRLGSLIARLSEQDRVRLGEVGPVDAVALARRLADQRGALHPVAVAGDAQLWVEADADLLERLLGHLIQNAIDASATGAPVTIRLRGDGGSGHIDVEDRGAGMSSEFIRNSLFRPFVSTKDGGFGIGAFQARQFAEAMGGQLTVSSREGEGSTFRLTLERADHLSRDAQTEAA